MTNTQHQHPGKRLLTIKEVADTLTVSQRAFRRLVDSGKAPTPVRLGRSVRWESNAIEQWIAEGCPKRRDA